MNDEEYRILSARHDAAQDQEIAAGVEWMRESDAAAVGAYWNALNDADETEGGLRAFSDDDLKITRAMAMIGFHEVIKQIDQ